MEYLRRVPHLSRPFFRASLVDTIGSAVLLGTVLPFGGVIARRLGAGPGLLSLLAMAPFRLMVAGLEMASTLCVFQMSRARSVPTYVGVHYWFVGVRGVVGPVIGVALYKSGILSVVGIYWLITAIVLIGGIALLVLCRFLRRGNGG